MTTATIAADKSKYEKKKRVLNARELKRVAAKLRKNARHRRNARHG